MNLGKLLARYGLAESVNDGLRKIMARVAQIDGAAKTEPILHVKVPAEMTIRVGPLLRKQLQAPRWRTFAACIEPQSRYFHRPW